MPEKSNSSSPSSRINTAASPNALVKDAGRHCPVLASMNVSSSAAEILAGKVNFET